MPSSAYSRQQEGFPLDKPRHWAHLADNERKRQEALLEFVSTEANYYERLTTIHEVYYSGGRQWLDAEQVNRIFQNLDELLLRSGLFLADLRALQWKGNGIIASVASTLSEHLPQFTCFQVYCKGHKLASETLHNLTRASGSSRFAKFLDEAVQDVRSANLDLATLLLEPVQRVARYPLLLKQVLHHTTRDHGDHAATLQAVLDSEQFLNQVNEAVRLHESRERLQEIQQGLLVCLENEFDVGFELIGRTRQGFERNLLLESPLWKCKSKRPLVGLILTDMIVLLESKGKHHFRLYREPLAIDEIQLSKIDFSLTKLRLASGLDKEACMTITKGAEIVSVAAQSEEERRQWQSHFERAKIALARGQEPIMPALNLFCIGTVLITVVSARGLPLSSLSTSLSAGSEMSTIALQINNQKTILGPVPGTQWNQSIVLSMASFDDRLLLQVSRYHKYSPADLLARAELSLDFLEYYDQRATETIKVDLNPRGQIYLQLQYHSAF